MAYRPLPTVIGPTENALRALLTRVLISTPIGGYEEWVALNYASQGVEDLPARVAEALKVDPQTGALAIEQLAVTGLFAADGLTAKGRTELAHARAAVTAVTATLVEEITEADQQVTRRVLDTIRSRAELATADV